MRFTKFKPMKPKYFYEYEGKKYSLPKLSKMSGIAVATIVSRMKEGWSLKKAVETPTIKHKKYLYGGKEYSLADLGRVSKVSRNTVNRRLKNGWPVKKAVETPSSIEKEFPSVSSLHRDSNRKTSELKLFATCRYRSN